MGRRNPWTDLVQILCGHREPGIITCIKFGDDRLRGFWWAGCQSLPFPIDLALTLLGGCRKFHVDSVRFMCFLLTCISFSLSFGYVFFTNLSFVVFSEESCSVIGLSEKVSFQLRSELPATDVRWVEVRWKCVPVDRNRDGETSLTDGRVWPRNEQVAGVTDVTNPKLGRWLPWGRQWVSEWVVS